MPFLVDPQTWAWILEAATAGNIPPEPIAAVIETESAWVTGAIGDNGHSFGLMQLYDQGAGAGYDPETLLDPHVNIRIGGAYLAACFRVTGTWPDAFSAYNQGIGGWERNGQATNPGYVAEAGGHLANYQLAGIRARRGGEILCAYNPFA